MNGKNHKLSDTLYHIAITIMTFFAIFFLLQLAIGSLIYRVFITLDWKEAPIYYHNSFLIVLECAGLLLMLFLYRRVTKNISDGKIFIFFVFAYIVAGLYLILRTEPYLRSDPYMIFKYVERFNEGDYSGFDKGYYMNMFPYQLGFLTYERLVALFTTNLRVFYFLNLLWVVLINFCQWRIVKHIFPFSEVTVKYTILMSFLFVPMFFSITWMYGQIPGFSLLCLSFLMLVRYLKGGKKYNLFLSVCFAAISYQLKMNYMIGIIAMIILLVLFGLKKKNLRYFVAIGLLVLAVGILKSAVPGYYKWVSGYNFGEGTPYISYIAMGLQENDGTRAPGWYNGYVFDVFIENDSDPDAVNDLSIQYIKKRIPEFIKDPEYTFVFFRDKITAAWCDPMFQSIWSGPIPDDGPDRTNDPVLKNIYKGGRIYEGIEAGMNALNIVILFGSIFFLFRKRLPIFKNNGSEWRSEGSDSFFDLVLFYAIFFIGGYIFHGISEVKGQYIYMYMYGLIPLAAYMMSEIDIKNSKNKKRNTNED